MRSKTGIYRPLVLAKAGTQSLAAAMTDIRWIPAFAGMSAIGIIALDVIR